MKKLYFLCLLFIGVSIQAQIVTIPDPNFKNTLINGIVIDFDGDGEVDGKADTNNDGEIQVSEAEAVIGLYLIGNDINSLEGIAYFANVHTLYCIQNNLTSLDVSSNTNLEVLDITNNEISNLILPNSTNFRQLATLNNNLTSLDLSQYPNLEDLLSGNNDLAFVNVQNGNNEILSQLVLIGNSNLNCVQVDNVAYAENNLDWLIPESAFYSKNCFLGIDDISHLQLTLFPNPVQKTLVIRSETAFDVVEIYSSQGQLVKKTVKKVLDVSNLTSGVYFAMISKDGQTVTKKFIKH